MEFIMLVEVNVQQHNRKEGRGKWKYIIVRFLYKKESLSFSSFLYFSFYYHHLSSYKYNINLVT